MAFNYSPKIVTDGLVLYLDAANTKSIVSGSTTWNDISRGGTNGTLVNGPTFDSGNGGSIVFDGVNDYIDIIPSILVSSTNSLSFNFWVYAIGTSTASQTILGKGNNVGGLGHLIIRRIANTSLYFNFTNSNNTSDIIPFIDVFTNNINKWLNIQITSNYTTGTLICYLNGDLFSSKSMGANSILPNVNVTTYLGIFRPSASPWTGNISQSQIYNRALSSAEVLQNYNATKSRYGL